MGIKIYYFDKDRLEDMVGKIIIAYDEDEDDDKHLMDVASQ